MKSIMQKVAAVWSKFLGVGSTPRELEPTGLVFTAFTAGSCTVRGVKHPVVAGNRLIVHDVAASDLDKLRAEITASFEPAQRAMSAPIAPVTGRSTITDICAGSPKLTPVQGLKSALGLKKVLSKAPHSSTRPLKGKPSVKLKATQATTLASRVEAFFKKPKAAKGMRVGQVLEALNLPKEKEAVLRTVMFNLKNKGVLSSPAKGLFIKGVKL